MVGWLVGAILLLRDVLWILITPLLTANLTLIEPDAVAVLPWTTALANGDADGREPVTRGA